MESDEENEDDAKAQEPTFSLADKKEPFYVKDPSKALKNFYEKEGMFSAIFVYVVTCSNWILLSWKI